MLLASYRISILQFVADNIDHFTHTLDCLSTFHGMGMISTVNVGIKCTSRKIPHVAVTAEDVAAVAKECRKVRY